MAVQTIKEWATALREDGKSAIKEYENTLTALYKDMGIPLEYEFPFMTSCYKKYPFKKKLVHYIFANFLVFFIIGLIMAIAAWFVLINAAYKTVPLIEEKGIIINALTTKQYGYFDAIKDFGSSKILPAALIGLGVIIICKGFYILIKYLSYKSKINKLDSIEAKEKNLIMTVPASYRTSEKMQVIAQVYFTKPDIDPSKILQCVDTYIGYPSYERTSKFNSIMYDLPCECPFLNVSDSQIESYEVNLPDQEEDPNAPKKSPYLPQDIDSKLFEGSQNSEKDLNSMIGLGSVKQQIEKLENRIKFYGNGVNNGNHMAFMGSAGTGKTSVARIITKILFDLGYIKYNQYLEISGDYICAGDTNRASAIIEYSYGRVLFIDEAYLMYGAGTDIIGVLLKAMEDHRSDFICILAGYEEQMTKLFASNEGFSSRIKHTIYFPDYTEDEMLDIFNFFIKNYNGKSYSINPNAIDTLKSAFTLEKKAKSFGNARTVRNAVDAIMDYYVDRSISSKSDTKIIELEDIEKYQEDRKKFILHELKNSSAADQVDEQIIRLSELKPRMKNGSENPDSDLEEMVGVLDIKDEMDLLKNQKEFYDTITSQKILILGDEECDKDSLVKVITGYLYQYGYISENQYLEIPAEILKGSFLGHTAKRADAIIKYASSGVLYLKNYNLLASSDNDSFASEALSAIANALNDENVTIILADTDLTAIDSLKNSFNIIYNFPEYTKEQLYIILIKKFNKEGFIVAEEENNNATKALFDYICNNNVTLKTLNTIMQATIKKHISNFNGDESQKYTISRQDIAFSNVPKLKLSIKR